MISPPERKPSLALLAAMTALAFSALHIVLPALPILTHAFDDTPSRVQLVVTLFLAGIAAGQLFYGPISDRFGRRPVLIAGHSPSRIEYHAVSRLRPLMIMCWRKTPSNVTPKRSAAARERALRASHFHSSRRLPSVANA